MHQSCRDRKKFIWVVMGWSHRCFHSSVPGWESSVTIVMDNDETDARGRTVRWRTGSSLSDSAWPYVRRSLWVSHSSLFSSVCPGVRTGTAPFSMSILAFASALYMCTWVLSAMGPSAYTQGSSWLRWREDSMNRQLAPCESPWEGVSESKEVPFSIQNMAA